MIDFLGQNLEIGDFVVLEQYSKYKGICLGCIIEFTNRNVRVSRIYSVDQAKNFDMIQALQTKMSGVCKLKDPKLLIKIDINSINTKGPF